MKIDVGADHGIMKLLKTREMFLIEANIPFTVNNHIECDETYVFPEDRLLMNSNPKYLRNIKEIFKGKVKQEILELNFLENSIHIKGDINKKFDYDIQASKFESYGEYIDNGHGQIKKFTINLALKHFLGLIKICDVIESNFKIALDLLESEECSTFMYANTHNKDLQFMMGQGGVKFTPLD